MKELIEYIARSLVDNPEDVKVTEIENERSTVLELRVAPEDMGKVIGKQGKIAQSIRTLTKAAAAKALADLTETAAQGSYDVIILEEIVYFVSIGLAAVADVRRLIERKNPRVELVLTGRGATVELIAMADLVTEMKPIKHPFEKGLPARAGIEY